MYQTRNSVRRIQKWDLCGRAHFRVSTLYYKMGYGKHIVL